MSIISDQPRTTKVEPGQPSEPVPATHQTFLASADQGALAHPFSDAEAVRAVRREDLPPLTDRAIKVLGQIHQAQDENPGPVANFLGLVKQEIWQAGDSPAVLDQVIALMEQQRTTPPAPCPVYSWCYETGDHGEHTGRSVWATCPDAYDNPVLPVGLIDWGKGVKVGLLDLDLTPAEARDKLAELRTHLDNVEALIVLAEAGQ
ncbi:hypothetical protein ACFV0H_07500 [Streptomyces erythrochromogenes]|uniref:hypothetical protein n=1 Tax=Streptomyces erythrochromogenes TaxID=285574 RepID=UPI0036B0AF21